MCETSFSVRGKLDVIVKTTVGQGTMLNISDRHCEHDFTLWVEDLKYLEAISEAIHHAIMDRDAEKVQADQRDIAERLS